MSNPPDILKKILDRKVEEIAAASASCSLAQLKKQLNEADPARGFVQSLRASIASGHAGVIAEIKKASPSKGVIREDFDPVMIAQSYEQAGASCLSVLTDRDFFQGHEDYLKQARSATSLPVIRKDFIIDPYQVYEAKSMNADCILLIVSALSDDQLSGLYYLARELGMDALIEVHDLEEMYRALELRPDIVGVNNRNLRTFETSLDTTLDLMRAVPDDCLLVTESGIHEREDVALMRKNEVHAFLVGEAMMRADNPGDKLRELFV